MSTVMLPMLLFEYLESNPIIEIQKTTKILNLSFITVSGAIDRLIDAKIIVQPGSEQRNRILPMKNI